MKEPGYFWIKTDCMPKALRVFCDFLDNYPNFYAYVGNDITSQTPIKVVST